MKIFTIIGGGASGTLLAANLLRNSNGKDLRVNIVEKRGRLGRGVAYSTGDPVHLLNVPAAKMGAFADDIGGFHRWLSENGHSFAEGDFVPRMLFGQYLSDVLGTAAAEAGEDKLIHRDDEALGIDLDENWANVRLASGETLVSDAAILAFGNFLPPDPNIPDTGYTSHPKYFRDQWHSDLYSKISPDDPILIIGTGLSMVDLALHFHDTGHQGKVTAISTRGLLPEVHAAAKPYPSFFHEIENMSRVTDIMRVVRRHAKNAESAGSNWRGVIDSLRPHTQQIWRRLSLPEKRIFMEHLSRHWNVARHRMPPQAAAVLNEMQAAGKLEILRGRLSAIEVDTADKLVTRYRSAGVEISLVTNAVINCIGSESNFERIDSPLVKHLLASGTIKKDGLSMGIAADENYRIIDAAGRPLPQLRTLGTALKGTLWETTAIPEIRHQAGELALRIIDEI